MKMDKAAQSLFFYWSLVILDALTLLVNFITCVMFIRFRKKLLCNTHNRILFSMALADMFVGLFGMALGILLLMKQSSLYYKSFGNIPMFSSLFISVLSLALLTIDRLIAIKKPFKYSSSSYRRTITRLILVSWVVPIIISIQQCLIFVYISSKVELIVRSILFSGFFLLAAFVLIFFNGFLVTSIRSYFSKINVRFSRSEGPQGYGDPDFRPRQPIKEKSEIPIQIVDVTIIDEEMQEEGRPEIRSRHSRNMATSRRNEIRQTSIFCIILVSLFILFWLPLAVYRTCYAAGVSLQIAWLRRFALCLTIVNSLLNPVLYFLVKKELRKHLIKLFSWSSQM